MYRNKKTSSIGIIITIIILVAIVIISNIQIDSVTPIENGLRKTCYANSEWLNISKELVFWQQ